MLSCTEAGGQQYTQLNILMSLSKAGQPDYMLADRFINRQPVYEPVRFIIGLQHIYGLQAE